MDIDIYTLWIYLHKQYCKRILSLWKLSPVCIEESSLDHLVLDRSLIDKELDMLL